MLLNKWEFRLKDGEASLKLVDSDMEERVDTEPSVCHYGGYAFIYFERKDEAQNRKYRDVILMDLIHACEADIADSTKTLRLVESLKEE